MAVASEVQFQADILKAMTTGTAAYEVGDQSDYDAMLALDGAQFKNFIEETQAEQFALLVSRYGGDQEVARKKLLIRLGQQLDTRGTISVLRDGFEDQRVHFRAAYFKPASGMNSQLLSRYSSNKLTVVKELRYASKHTNRLDLALFVNGIPVSTVELKNPLSGQGVDKAIVQYMTDRDPSDKIFNSRAVVHFAVDPNTAFMTTQLNRKDTTFLPFNRGNDDGGGNPPAPPGEYKTHYLWDSVWSRDAWLDILGRFVHQRYNNKTRRVDPALFPRYHQWDAVLKMEEAARESGPGRKYLCQHSAGSGKSNTISWLAHRLSVLHDRGDKKIFDKVIVLTDRRVLDRQLRSNVETMEKVKGTVISVTESGGSKSSQLADALRSNSQIVISTVQTFPYVLSLTADDDLRSRNYAVLIDEAHSSQTGDAALAVKQAFGAEVAAALEESEGLTDDEAAINAVLAARKDQSNMSLFAFTATPKPRTTTMFGSQGADGVWRPFHLYAMRQAIEEGFILDVLASYITYETYYRLATKTEEAGSQVVEVSEASRSLRRVAVAHPQLIAEKARIIVEHTRKHVLQQLNGEARAMVVTDSRKAAVRYKQAIDSYIRENAYTQLRALVAFSGKVKRPDDTTSAGSVRGEGEVFTESSMNGFAESETILRFQGEEPFPPREFSVLIVAEKYQTGFDEPRLTTMFVDKILSGVNAVQTLSRLNRMCPGKEQCLVLDFRNERAVVQREFQNFYKGAATSPVDANALADSRTAVLEHFDVLDLADVNAAAEAYFVLDPRNRKQADIYAALAPAVLRFNELDEDDQASFRKAVDRYVRMYAFLSQVFPDGDALSEKLYVYLRALIQELPQGAASPVRFADSVVMTHLSVEKSESGTIALENMETEASAAFPGEGLGGRGPEKTDFLSSIIEDINQAKGLNLDETHRLAIDQVMETIKKDPELRPVAKANTYADFLLEFRRALVGSLLDVEKSNQELFDALIQDGGLRQKLADFYGRDVFDALRNSPDDHGQDS